MYAYVYNMHNLIGIIYANRHNRHIYTNIFRNIDISLETRIEGKNYQGKLPKMSTHGSAHEVIFEPVSAFRIVIKINNVHSLLQKRSGG